MSIILPVRLAAEMKADERAKQFTTPKNPFSIEVRRQSDRDEVGRLLASLRLRFIGALKRASEPEGLLEMQENAVMELARKLLGDDWDCEVPT